MRRTFAALSDCLLPIPPLPRIDVCETPSDSCKQAGNPGQTDDVMNHRIRVLMVWGYCTGYTTYSI